MERVDLSELIKLINSTSTQTRDRIEELEKKIVRIETLMAHPRSCCELLQKHLEAHKTMEGAALGRIVSAVSTVLTSVLVAYLMLRWGLK